MSKQNVNTIFDDVFRTMVEKMPELVIPVINEVFHTSYTDQDLIRQERNEHETLRGKIITDSCLRFRDKVYHVECQSWDDKTMVIRMMEYDFAIALENAKIIDGEYRIEFPRSCVIFLRNYNLNHLKALLCFQDGTKHQYQIPAVSVQSYSLKEIFQKELLLFLPYYILRYDGKYTEIAIFRKEKS